MVDNFSDIDFKAVDNGDVLQLKHTKSNTGPRAKTIWLKRDGPDFVEIDMHVLSMDKRNEKNLILLYEWFIDEEGNNNEPFFKKDVLPSREAPSVVWGRALAREGARALLGWAEEEGYLVHAEGGKNQNSPYIVRKPERDAL